MTTDRSQGEWDQAVRQQAAVARLGQLGLQSSDLEEVLRESMLVAAETLGIGDVALFEVIPAAGILRGRAALHKGLVVPRPSVDRLRIPAGTGSLPGFAAEQRVPVVSSDVVDDPRFVAVAADFDLPVRAAIAAPIRWADEVWGVFGVWDRQVREWTDDEVRFLQAVANTMGLTIQRSAIEQDLRDSSLRLDLSLSAGGLGTWSWNLDRDAVTLSQSAMRMHGLGTGSFTGTAEEFLALVHPDDRASLRGGVFEAAQTAAEQHHLFRIVRRDNGELRWIESWGRLLAEEDGSRNVVGVSSDVTERRRAEEQKETMLAREHAARLDAEAARERLAFLSESSARLSTSLDPDVTLASLIELCVPYLADVCLIDIVDEDGNLTEQAAQAIDDDALRDARELRRRRAAVGGIGGIWTELQVALEARTVVHTELTEVDFQRAAIDSEHLQLMRRFAARSAVIVPLIARGRVLGVMTLMRIREERRYGNDDVSLTEEFAARAALAIDNGKLFHSRNRVARSLQAALLPPALPQVEGLALSARYQVAEADVAIGGDFYDVIELGDHSWGVVVGDVCGRGPDAAALTGLMRHSVRTVVVREERPSEVLAQTNAAVLDQIDDAKFCTAAYLRLSLDDAAAEGSIHVVASSAGHPRPAVVRATGEAWLLDCAGTLLGVVEEPRLVDTETDLLPGDAVVLYTDGVTEARNDRELFGEKRLLAALAELAGQSAESIAAGLEAAVTSFRNSASDDTAILVAQAAPPGWRPGLPTVPQRG
jgi:PAS domain S-box-containing protein